MASRIRHMDCYPPLALGDPQRGDKNNKATCISFITTLALKTEE